jgi:hypothetical protein
VGPAGAHLVPRLLVRARLQQRPHALQTAVVSRPVQRSLRVLSEGGAEERQQGDSSEERRRQRKRAAANQGGGEHHINRKNYSRIFVRFRPEGSRRDQSMGVESQRVMSGAGGKTLRQ